MTTQAGGTGGGKAVVVDGVWKRFGTTDVVADLSFDVGPKEILGFLGPNGAGKTTTMRMILDIIRPDSGTIRVFDQPSGVEHQARIGYLPEDRGLYRDVPVVDTLAYFGALRGLPLAESKKRATKLLTDVGLGDSLTKKGAELSRGMHQKAQLVATIINEPDLLIVDEPFSGLDPVNAQMLKELLLAQRDRGAAVIMSTHDMEDAQVLCDRIVLIDKGRRLLYGAVGDVRRAFSDGAVEVQGSDLPLDTTALPAASHATAYDGSVRYLLRDGQTAQDLFRELAATPAVVERFAVEAPNLAEIFVRAVAGDERAERVA
ncbi:MAG TPA: ATP-binding cassette domain-containing protein [Candidatus Limnocylindrales bacterium]